MIVGLNDRNVRANLFHELFKFSSVEYGASLESKILVDMYLDDALSGINRDAGCTV